MVKQLGVSQTNSTSTHVPIRRFPLVCTPTETATLTIKGPILVEMGCNHDKRKRAKCIHRSVLGAAAGVLFILWAPQITANDIAKVVGCVAVKSASLNAELPRSHVYSHNAHNAHWAVRMGHFAVM